MSYLLDKGYHVDPSFDALEGSYEFDPRANGQPEEIKAILRDFGPESYAFQDEGTLNHYPVFWYVHNSKGIHMLRHREIWNINTINVESLLVFDEPYKATEIKESVPLFMDAIIRNKNVKAQKLMNGNVTRRDFLLVEVKIKDRMVTDKEQVDRGKRVTTYKGFDYPIQFYSPQYPDGPLEDGKKRLSPYSILESQCHHRQSWPCRN